MRLRAFCRNASVAVLAAAPALAAPALADCPAPGAAYRLATDPDGIQGEIRLAADPALLSGTVMVLVLPGRPDTRFEMIQAQGYGSTSVWALPGGVLPAPDDGLPLALLEQGPDGRLLPYAPGIPFPDSPAPAAFLIPGLGPALWYDTADRIGIDPAIWYRHACGG
jgi:hypothetical protein